MPLERRQLLHLFVAGGVAIAGCTNDGPEGRSSSPSPSRSSTRTATPTETDASSEPSSATTTDEPETDAPSRTPGATTGTDARSTTDTLGTTETDDPVRTTTETGRTIDMTGSVFGTVRATVDVGTTVTWVNRDGVPHTVTSVQFHDGARAWAFDERAESGERITYSFAEAGVYEYYCTIHGRGTMCGVVLVGGATLDASLPCE